MLQKKNCTQLRYLYVILSRIIKEFYFFKAKVTKLQTKQHPSDRSSLILKSKSHMRRDVKSLRCITNLTLNRVGNISVIC